MLGEIGRFILKTVKPLTSKKPPVPKTDYGVIREWIADIRPKINPVVAKLDALICDNIDNPLFAVKWNSAFYGASGKGWLIQLSAYDKSVNVVFLNGNRLIQPPELGGETRYVKLYSMEDADSVQLDNWLTESCKLTGWAWE